MKLGVILLLVSVMAPPLAYGDSPTEDLDYSFGGSCASSGSWTQRALQNTAAIKQAITRLQGYSECEGLRKFAEIQGETNKNIAQEDNNDVAGRMENIPNRESALITFAGIGNQNLRTSTLQALLKEKFNLATANGFTEIKNGFGSASGLVSTGVMNQAADFIDAISSTFPSFSSCVVNHPEETAGVLSGLVNLAANLVGPTGGFNPRLNGSISNLINMVTKVPAYAGAKKILNEVEFWQSMACLIETTAESYCSVIDANHMINADYLNQKVTVKDGVINDFGDPLAGYDILILHMPNISAWVQKIQFGIEPQWDTDAEFKISAFENTANYMTAAWHALGTFNGMKNIYNKRTSVQAKKNFLLQMLTVAVTELQKGAQSVDFKTMGSDLNFFTMVQQVDAIPFYLVGLKDAKGNGKIPLGAIQNELGGDAIDWGKYMKGDGSFTNPKDPTIKDVWSDPDSLLKTIEANLREIIRNANHNASDFYQDRIIVNQENLVAAALSSTRFTVHHSFIALYNYLDHLHKMFSASNPNDSDFDENKKLLPMINDLQHRVGAVIEAFNSLSPKGLPIHPKTSEDKKKIEGIYAYVIKKVYDQFDVLYQRDSYITNALVELVKADYAYRINHNIGFGDYEQKLIRASGEDFINLLMTLHGMVPTRVLGDIKRASIIGDKNLTAIEKALGDDLLKAIDQIDMYLSGKGSGDLELFRRSARRLMDDTFNNGVAWRDNWGRSLRSAFFGWIDRIYTQANLRPNRYNFPMNSDWVVRPDEDNSVGGWRYFRDELCILSLAFNHRQDYAESCKGAVLVSLHPENKDASFELNASYDALLNAKRGPPESAVENNYKDNTICAYRNYHRKNLVFRIINNVRAGLKVDGDIYGYTDSGGEPAVQ